MELPIKVFKFGGASVKDADAIRNVGEIIANFNSDRLLVVISAFGKNTNKLEELLELYRNKNESYKEKVAGLLKFHLEIADQLCPGNADLSARINDLFVELEWALQDTEINTYDYGYDQVVSMGELLSTTIICAYLESTGQDAIWKDARDHVKTDETFRAANVDWKATEKSINEEIKPLLEQGKLVITQGFIGSTSNNETTTLGREGSDFTASIFAYCLNAEGTWSWKNVPGIMTADPYVFSDALKLEKLSYKEAIEMTYYGARVIHPKTIRPLQVKGIPLYLRSFETPETTGTTVHHDGLGAYPPVVILLYDQVLLTLSATDYTFITENHIAEIFAIFDKWHIKVNLTQNSALKFYACVGDAGERLSSAIEELEASFKTEVRRGLELCSIRHYTDQKILEVLSDKKAILQEKTMTTARFVVEA